MGPSESSLMLDSIRISLTTVLVLVTDFFFFFGGNIFLFYHFMSSNNKNILSKKKVLYYFLNDVIRKCLFSYMEEFEFLNLMPIPLSLCD